MDRPPSPLPPYEQYSGYDFWGITELSFTPAFAPHIPKNYSYFGTLETPKPAIASRAVTTSNEKKNTNNNKS